ncbi:MAG: 4-hydroxythreonine-4-phosphate dehydrogenase PdxA, partial [Clostridia bacterium]
MSKPIIGIPMGDPAGIGPEIILKALAVEDIYEICRPVVIGSAAVLRMAECFVHSGLSLNPVSSVAGMKANFGTIDVFDIDMPEPETLAWGKVDGRAGAAAYEYIKKAAELCMDNSVDAMATAPINKESIRAAGIDFIGHTEMLAHLSGTEDPLTMFQVRNMRVFFLSRHMSLRAACDAVKKDKIKSYIGRSLEALERLGIKKPLLAVAGLNPHNGEHGMFGNEEPDEIFPAVSECAAEGLNVIGPVPADSVFAMALKGRYDGVLSLYHDQGHIATKTVD